VTEADPPPQDRIQAAREAARQRKLNQLEQIRREQAGEDPDLSPPEEAKLLRDRGSEGSSGLIITMLGASKSGKTMCIAGMYEQLLEGDYGYHLSTADPDVGMDLVDQLDKLRGGKVPEPTSQQPVRYSFILRGDGVRIPVDLTDFRGGAAFERLRGTREGDAAQLRTRLGVSHSIFVTLDSIHFVDPVGPERVQEVKNATRADRFADLINAAVDDRLHRGSLPPSIAVLLTKADLLNGRRGSTPDEWSALEREIRSVLRAPFRQGVATKVFPVSVGRFPVSPDDQPQITGMEPNALADPVIFAAGNYLKMQEAAARRLHEQALESSAAAKRFYEHVKVLYDVNRPSERAYKEAKQYVEEAMAASRRFLRPDGSPLRPGGVLRVPSVNEARKKAETAEKLVRERDAQARELGRQADAMLDALNRGGSGV
jgi:hypothetical protein